MGDVIVPPIAKLTFERYADISLAATAAYTPTTTGLYHCLASAPIAYNALRPEYYSAAGAAWVGYGTRDYGDNPIYGNFLSDGSNFRIYNVSGASQRIVLFRMGYSTPNPSPKVGRRILYGKPSIVLESDEKGFIWIEEEELLKLLPDIKVDVEDKMGYGKYKSLLRGLGFDV